MPTVFVTTGATVVFEKLIRSTLDTRFVQLIRRLGYSKLVVQYGRDGQPLFQECLSKLNDTDIEVEGFAFSGDIGAVISQADLVVSHAGTGSILDTLRLDKKLIVMINDTLMDNHQLEIAQELEHSNHLLKTTPSLESLLSCVEKVQALQLDPLPTPNGEAIESVLLEL